MVDDAEPVRCIRCGGPVGELNETEDQGPCPACAERLLETLPGIFHVPWTADDPAEAPSEREGGRSRPSRPE